MSKELDNKDFKYIRFGHLDNGRKCDQLVKLAVHLLPGTGELPSRWRYVSRQHFLQTYGDCGKIVWSKTYSYHLLLLDGHYAMRLWTDSPDSVLVDVDTRLATELASHFEVRDIPESTWRKTKPFKKRIRIETETQVKILILQALLTFRITS